MDYEKANMAQKYEHEIPEGYEARIDGNKVIIELKESEDELIRKRLINLIKELAANKEAIHTGGYFVDGQDKKYIAYLEKQKEQKPVEWSEEDEMMLTSIISTLRVTNGAAQMKIDWLNNRVKSLRPRPHWKPSEEQIGALERAIIKVHTHDDIDILAELRDNLKKL